MSVPRPPIRLVQRVSGSREVALVSGGGDVQTAVRAYCDSMRAEFERHRLHGYLFKARSPSCGVVDTPHFSESGVVLRTGPGLWAETMIKAWPDLPIADESDLADENGRQAFLLRIRAYQEEIG